MRREGLPKDRTFKNFRASAYVWLCTYPELVNTPISVKATIHDKNDLFKGCIPCFFRKTLPKIEKKCVCVCYVGGEGGAPSFCKTPNKTQYTFGPS